MSEQSRHTDPPNGPSPAGGPAEDDARSGGAAGERRDGTEPSEADREASAPGGRPSDAATGHYEPEAWRDPSSARSGSGLPARREPAPSSGYPASGEGAPDPGAFPGQGPVPSTHPGDRDRDDVGVEARGEWPIQPLKRRRPRTWVNVVLFVITAASVLYWAYLQYQVFYLRPGDATLDPFAAPEALIGGIPYALAVIVFLMSHEMGHYLACRWYDIDATLPYFIPMPALIAPLLPGTMGAVIRIIAPIKSRRALFDIAVAGPIAGFVVSLPILAVGLSQSRVISDVEGSSYLTMGEPLIWGVMADWFGPATTASQDLLVHPLAYVGWFAMLVTAMNLLPVGQLDGGHLLYALFPRAHRAVSLLVLGGMVVAGWYYFTGWIVFALIIFFLLGTRHPRPQRFESSLGGNRLLLAVAAAAIFVSTFILVPVELGDLVG